MGFRSYPTGLSIPEAISMTFSFFRSDKPCRSDPLVLAKLLRQWQDLSFLTSGISIRPSQPEFMIFKTPLSRVGAPRWRLPDFGFCTRLDHKLHINTLELYSVILALHHWVSLGHQLKIAADNTTVVAYINKQGGTYSHILLRLVVDLFLWLQTQDIAIWTRHIRGCLIVIGLSWPNQPITTEWILHPEIVTQMFGTWGTPIGKCLP